MGLKLILHTTPDVPVEAEVINPDLLKGLSEKDVASQAILHGSDKVTLGDFFKVSGTLDNGLIEVEGDLSRVKMIGGAMSSGKIVVAGNVGAHLGVAMSGGEILVEGNAADWVGPEMLGGRITVKGNAGHMVGSAFRGSQIGITGGEIIIHGNAGNEVGNTMRDGLIVIGGKAGDFVGVNMKAGTIFVLGEPGQRYGAGMIRGTIVTMNEVEMLPTFSYACTYQPTFLRGYLGFMKSQGLAIGDAHINGKYERWSGDSIELNRGEMLILKS